MAHEDKPAEPTKIIQIKGQLVQSQLIEVVRGTVEETLNALLDAEADRLLATLSDMSARKYVETAVREATSEGWTRKPDG